MTPDTTAMDDAPAPKCPSCGALAVKSDTRYGPRFEHCGMYAWGHHPLASPDTHKARVAAHAAFDALWKSGRMTRSAAYAALASALQIDAKDCHMKLMDEATALRVPAITAVLAKHGEG